MFAFHAFMAVAAYGHSTLSESDAENTELGTISVRSRQINGFGECREVKAIVWEILKVLHTVLILEIVCNPSDR